MSDPFKRPDKEPEGLHQSLNFDNFAYAYGYSAGERIVALSGQEGDAQHSLYGRYKDKEKWIARRNWANPTSAGDTQVLPYVLDFSLGAEFINKVNLLRSTLALDERGLVGAEPAVPFPDKGWAAAVVGELCVDASPALVLRPSLVQFKKEDDGTEVLTATEVGRNDGNDTDAPPSLVATLSPTSAKDVGAAFTATAVETPVTALFDRLNDGGWEQVSPIWLATTQGFLRVPQAETGTVPYGLGMETRPIEVSSWFADSKNAVGLPAGAKVFLMLDRSGTKTLTVSMKNGGVGAHGVELKLTVSHPALDIVLPSVTCDTTLLVDPQAPPGTAAVQGGPALHLVSPPLAPKGLHGWLLSVDAKKSTLTLPVGTQDNRPVHFAPHMNWVLPWEAAVNAPEESLSALRVLIPQACKGEKVTLDLSSQGIEVRSEAVVELAKDEVGRHGPVATFVMDMHAASIHSEELNADPQSRNDLAAEPAVLRPEYRTTPVLDAAGKATHAPFSATHALNLPKDTKFTPPNTATSTTAAERYCLDPSSGKPALRVDASRQPPDSFGWPASHMFFRRGSRQDHRLEWLEANASDKSWTVTPWLRLSDDSLVKQDSWPSDLGDDVSSLSEQARTEGWTLKSAIGEEVRDKGLSLFTLKETSARVGDEQLPEFWLYLEGMDLPVTTLMAPASAAVVNRLVLASSPWRTWGEKAQGPKVGAVTLSGLNCLYLELERTGSKFRVMRGMLGWTLSGCFGLSANGTLQYTEFYERDEQGVLGCTVEFNGGAKFEPFGNGEMNYTLEVYFWSSVLQQAPGGLRVMCKHVIEFGETEHKVVSLQDAQVNGNFLDLSCDVAMFGVNTNPSPEERVAFDAWETSRRGLFTATLERRSLPARPEAFLKVRMASDKKAHVETAPDLRPRLQPSWRESDSQILPWFSTDLRDKRNQTTWLREHRLNTAGSNPGRQIDVTLYLLGAEDLNAEAYRACTLGRPANPNPGFDVIARWIPSPVTDIVVNEPTQVRSDRANLSRLWLFDPSPNVIAEWPPGGAANPDQKYARELLAGLGWTREAVLDTAAATEEGGNVSRPKWELIDSPLLNRDVALGWMGWPLHPNIVDGDRPRDELPLTRQVVHEPAEVQEVSVRVLFDVDGKDAGGKNTLYQYPQVYVPAYPTSDPIPADAKVTGIQFKSPGLRVGVQHLAAVEYSKAPPSIFNGWKIPSTDTGSLVVEPIDDGSGDVWLKWEESGASIGYARRSGDGIDLDLPSLPEQSVSEKFVVFNEAPAGLFFTTSENQSQPVVLNQSCQVAADAKSINLQLGGGALWSAIRLTVTRKNGESIVDTATAAYFSSEGLAARLAGVFVDGQLLRFGREPVWFVPPTDGGPWKRVCSVRFSLAGKVNNICVAAIDMLGRAVLYAKKSRVD